MTRTAAVSALTRTALKEVAHTAIRQDVTEIYAKILTAASVPNAATAIAKSPHVVAVNAKNAMSVYDALCAGAVKNRVQGAAHAPA